MPETFSFVTHSSSSASPAPSPRHKHSPLSPAATQLNPNFFKMHDPTSSKQAVTNCPDCGRSVLHSAFIQHAAQCQRPRARSPSQQPSASDQPVEDSGSLQKKRRFSDVSLSTASPPPTNKKSRPSPAPSASIAGSDVGGGPGEGKKEKKEAKKKKTEPVLSGKVTGATLDLSRYCGVWNPEKKQYCSRSLTCKSHPMGAKRAVQGRPKPFDELLLQWNRENKAGFVEPKPKAAGGKRKEDASRTGADGAGSEPRARRSGKAKGPKLSRENRSRPSNLSDSACSTSSAQDLSRLLAAACSSRAALSAPTTALSWSARTNSRPLTTLPPTLTPARRGPSAAAAAARDGRVPTLPREASKSLLYGRRREQVARLDDLLRDALVR